MIYVAGSGIKLKICQKLLLGLTLDQDLQAMALSDSMAVNLYILDLAVSAPETALWPQN